MTSPASIDIPKPLDWQHFERLARAVFSEAKHAGFARFGREGQRQSGIDVIGHLSDGTLVAVQCKGRTSSLGKRLTEKNIDDAIAEAETYSGKLDEFFIVTTANDEVALQQYVIQLSSARQAAGEFSVSLWGWQSMSDQIRSCPGVLRTFYGEWWTRPSFKFVASLIAIAVMLGSVGLVGSQRIGQLFALKDASRRTTVKGVQAVVATLEELQDAYGACISSMNGKAFVFSRRLRETCAKPVEAPLKRLQQQQDELAGIMNVEAFNEVVAANSYLDGDFRQLLIAVEMAEFFESRAVEVARNECPNSKYRIPASQGKDDGFRTSGKDALSAQMSRYFEIRDFVLPAITSLKARLAVAARMQSGQDIPSDLVQRANSLTDLLNQERTYIYKAPASPFAIARVKERSSRDITVTGPALDPVDELVWQQTALEATFEGLRGHSADIEYLISCGFLKPGAKALEAVSERR
ncbi:hypothetical protein [Burkholderia sp. S171]|uniref:hypothetical protein n=1 Tax=Burkholderia sp. S171 TaxID=1641860 RepID=UPI00131B1213|nr:hypothetical protein [Burkholderia sp. S171]